MQKRIDEKSRLKKKRLQLMAGVEINKIDIT
jgi:hypothetical protein